MKSHLDVLRAIEEIVSDDACHDYEWDLMKNHLKTDKEIEMAKKLGEIYKLAHAHGEHCKNLHTDWRLK